MLSKYNFADAQRLLIKPFERLWFVIIFILATSLSRVAADFICSQPAFDLLLEQNPIQHGIATGIITGTFIGAFQWLVLRRYIPDWKWILVTSVSSIFAITLQAALSMWGRSLFSSFSPSQASNTDMTLFVLVQISFGMGITIINGYLQWFVIRPYVIKAKWWIFLPLLTVLAVGISMSLLYFSTINSSIILRFNRYILQLTILGAAQAVGFCILKKKSATEDNLLQSPLALAPDIVNYWDIQKLEKKLYASLSKKWGTDLSTSRGELTYLVGVNRSGVIISSEPMNHASADNIHQTPLPELISNSSSAALEAEHLTSLAKFQVVFIPPAKIQIYSWRGIPLIWLGITVYVAIIVISLLAARLLPYLPFLQG
ncbi:MAG TPA: hypothetical protein VK203_26935 [Nostocaceae cyanobacterium]|nr:hypothetical protein [Nostocaceae cyanobacterium]